ncbi:MAG: hypothetical protein F4065_07160 [Rhodothermaceae bacterium]|nr:hypothetical protein [Rhodothermaceae bacterium]MXX97467.1 hypothetical protein [Rhodothermaceae bacterium]MXZ58765.1 hypothetical protein [Rhodothermaceae bacterium]MYE63279.1 hypothetical protein [Rhodothermaceae bacterium]MYJ06549.1 hypothetical protein [Rhodothermaceae bacterium]
MRIVHQKRRIIYFPSPPLIFFRVTDVVSRLPFRTVTAQPQMRLQNDIHTQAVCASSHFSYAQITFAVPPGIGVHSDLGMLNTSLKPELYQSHMGNAELAQFGQHCGRWLVPSIKRDRLNHGSPIILLPLRVTTDR